VVREYLVIYEWAGQNYSAYAPDLPGCVAAGDTLEETERLMEEAIALYIESLKETRQPVPEPITKAKSVMVAA
jgi:predicted RNase H-like HicB family nuclease